MIEELARVDSALCVSNYRDEFLSLIKSTMNYFVPSTLPSSLANPKYFIWIFERSLKLNSIEINSGNVLFVQTLLLLPSFKIRNTFQKVEYISMMQTNCSNNYEEVNILYSCFSASISMKLLIKDEGCISILSKCSPLYLKGIQFSLTDHISDKSLNYIAEKFVDLKKISLKFCKKISRLCITTLLEKCLKLEEIFFFMCSNVDSSVIHCMAVNSKNLKILDLRGCSELSIDSLIKLTSNCKFLNSLKFNLNIENVLLAQNEVRLNENDLFVTIANNCLLMVYLEIYNIRVLKIDAIEILLKNCKYLKDLQFHNTISITADILKLCSNYKNVRFFHS
jgi:hypothetical protein